MMMAVLRADHHLNAPEPRVLNDHLAMQLVGLKSPAEVGALTSRMVDGFASFAGRAAAENMVRDIQTGVCTRSRFVEDQLAASLARGMRQLVILGAGLDSMAYRSPTLTGTLAVFEVDHPATQAWKRNRLAAIDVPIPANVHFAPCDFEHQTLPDAMAAGGVHTDRMTFFSWLGVQPYLTHESVIATLDAVAAFPSGSELVLDLVTPVAMHNDDKLLVGRQEILAKAVGEPFLSAYEPEVFTALLAARGFNRIETITYREWYARRGMRSHSDGPSKPPRSVLVTAQVK